MSTHNICFHGEIRKILCGYPLLSVAMNVWLSMMISIAFDINTFVKENIKFTIAFWLFIAFPYFCAFRGFYALMIQITYFVCRNGTSRLAVWHS